MYSVDRFTAKTKRLGTSICAIALSSVLVASNALADECVPTGQVLIPQDKSNIDHVSLIQRVKDRPVVLLGEHHDNISHHRWQLQMITGLHTLNPDLVLGFEMFPRRAQAVLDEWVKGELSEKAFLEKSGWSDYWRFDPELYLPILHYARMNKIPMKALNVDRSLIREVGQKGWQGVDERKKEGVGRPAAPSEGYQQMLAGVFKQHDSHHGNNKKDSKQAIAEIMQRPSFGKFVESQQVWDRAMAEAIVSARQAHKDAPVVAILGSGHMMYGFGVPEQLADLEQPKPAILVPWDPEFECGFIQSDFADAVVGLRAIRFSDQEGDKQYPKIGIYLEKHDDGVLIGQVLEGSVGEQLKLKKGDVIVEMAGEPVAKVEDVISRVKGTRFGTWLPFTVDRAGTRMEFVAKFPPTK